MCTRAVVSTRGVEARLSRAVPFDVALDRTQLGPALADYLRLGGLPWRIASAEGESVYCLLMLRAGEGRHRSHLCWHRTETGSPVSQRTCTFCARSSRRRYQALSDRGDDSPEGQLTDGILDQLANFERAKTAERTRRGRLRKAR